MCVRNIVYAKFIFSNDIYTVFRKWTYASKHLLEWRICYNFSFFKRYAYYNSFFMNMSSILSIHILWIIIFSMAKIYIIWIMEVFGKRIKQILGENGQTQKALAKAINVQPSTLCEWLNGHNEPSMQDIVNIAVALGTSTDYLLGMKDYD